MIPDQVHQTASRLGMSILVGAVDRAGVPACCRGVALLPNDDRQSITVYVPLATSRDVVARAAATKKLAVVASHPIEHTSVQLKGAVRNLRLAGDAEAAVIDQKLAASADVLARIGLPRHIARSFNHWPAFAIEIAVEETYEQTPGPHAGEPIR